MFFFYFLKFHTHMMNKSKHHSRVSEEDGEKAELTSNDKAVVETLAKLLGLQEKELEQVQKDDLYMYTLHKWVIFFGKANSASNINLSRTHV